MTDHISDDFPTDNAQAHSTDDIIRLENEVLALKNEIADYQSEKERIQIEAKLSIEDAQLARSFSRKNYTPLLNELFQLPAKRLRRQNIILFTLSLLCIGVLLSYNIYTHLFPNTQSPSFGNEITQLNEKINRLEASIATTNDTIKDNHAALLNATKENKIEAEHNTLQDQDAASIKKQNPAAKEMTEKEKSIQLQARKISDYVNRAATQKGFPKDFTHNKTSLAQLYLIVMQHANKDKVYYESYLEAMRTLNISTAIMPNNISDLVQLDIDFLQATFSAYIITKSKQGKKWRYRESDQKFSSYYNPNLDYNLGPWQIVNDKKDYKNLPKIFSLNMKRIIDQLIYNKKTSSLTIPRDIYYSTYSENNKNEAIRKLLGVKTLKNNRNMLTINTHDLALPLNKEAVTRLQQKLAEKGFMSASIINGLLGPKTKKSIQNFQQTQNIDSNGKVSSNLLSTLEIQPLYSDLL